MISSTKLRSCCNVNVTMFRPLQHRRRHPWPSPTRESFPTLFLFFSCDLFISLVTSRPGHSAISQGNESSGHHYHHQPSLGPSWRIFRFSETRISNYPIDGDTPSIYKSWQYITFGKKRIFKSLVICILCARSD